MIDHKDFLMILFTFTAKNYHEKNVPDVEENDLGVALHKPPSTVNLVTFLPGSIDSLNGV